MAFPTTDTQLKALLDNMKAKGASDAQKKAVIDAFVQRQEASSQSFLGKASQVVSKADITPETQQNVANVQKEIADNPEFGKVPDLAPEIQAKKEAIMNAPVAGLSANTVIGGAKGIASGTLNMLKTTGKIAQAINNIGIPEDKKEEANKYINLVLDKLGEASESEFLQAEGTQQKVGKFAGELAPALAVSAGVAGTVGKLATGLSSKALSALGFSEKVTKALSPILGALTQSPLTTTAVTSSVKGELPTKGEVGVGMILDTIFPAFSAIKTLKSPTLTQAIERGISKGIKPSVAGQTTNQARQAYVDKAEDAVKTIVANKKALNLTDEFGETLPTGSVPKTLQQFSDAIEQTKTKIFSTYDDLAKKAGRTGLKVDMENAVSELDKIIQDKVLQSASPEMIDAANSLKSNLLGKEFTTEETQKLIQVFNEQLKAYYRNPTVEQFGAAKVKAMVANLLRKNLDTSISEITGGEYQALKNAYGSLSTLEKDVVKRNIIEANKAGKGMIDFSDIFSAGDVLAGIVTGNVGLLAKGVTQKAVASWFKALNSPNKAVQTMFEEANKLLPESTITGAGIVEAIEKQIPDNLTKKEVAELLAGLVKALTLGESDEQSTQSIPQVPIQNLANSK